MEPRVSVPMEKAHRAAAVAELQARGLLATRAGAGIYVAEVLGSAFSPALTIFPVELKATWPTVSTASGFLAQLKLGMFLATMGVLTGSLGGKADSRTVIQQVLFLDEET